MKINHKFPREESSGSGIVLHSFCEVFTTMTAYQNALIRVFW